MAKQTIKSAKATKAPQTAVDFPLNSENYKLMAIGFAAIVVGFILMCGNDDRNEIYSFRRIGLSSIIIVAGYLFEIYAIMKRPKEKSE